ncbi:MAG TPA: Hsp33 family molecular chaperone HslO [Bacillota bacterium]|nr:Hsp33 family molecular chaperone HslO [Bacillota bacterium]
MAGSDTAVRAVAGGGSILALAARTTELSEEARGRHGAWPTAAAALGRALTGAALLGMSLKEEGSSLTLRILGNGPIGGLIAEARYGGTVRGYARNPFVHLPVRADGKLDVGGAVGSKGVLHVTRDLGVQQPYTGSYPLVSGEIGEDLTSYLGRAEQIPSLVSLGVLVGTDGRVRSSGGLIIQLLPGAEDVDALRLEENVRRLGPVSRAVDDGAAPADLISAALSDMEPKMLSEEPLRFHCGCSRGRVRDVLVSLGPGELRAMLEEDGGAEAVCHFCGEKYRFDGGDLTEMLDRAGG